MLYKSKRYVLSLAPILIGAIALYNWVISPHVGYLYAMQRLDPIVDQMVEQKQRIGNTLDAEHHKLRALQRELAGAREKLFLREESKAFVHNLQSLVEQAGCTLIMAEFTRGEDTRQTLERDAPEAVEALQVGLTVWGQYGQIITLLERLQENRRAIWVDSCHMALLDSQEGRLECRLTLTSYVVLGPGESHG
jgi:hypothetical protein